MKKKDLLEILYECCGFQYISDLKSAKEKEKLYEVIKAINAQDFTMDDWIVTYKYLIPCEDNESKAEKERIKESLLAHLK